MPTRPSGHPSSILLSNVSFCVPILGTKNVTCLSDAPALLGFQRRTLTYSFLRGLAAPVIGKVRVLCYEFTGVTLGWEDGQWVEAHKVILTGCSPKKAPQPSCLSWMVLILMSRKQKRKRQTGPVSGCPKFVLWRRQLKKGAGRFCNIYNISYLQCSQTKSDQICHWKKNSTWWGRSISKFPIFYC